MTDAALLRAVMRATGVTSPATLAPILGVKARGAQYWMSGERQLHGAARQLCRLLVAHPELADELRED